MTTRGRIIVAIIPSSHTRSWFDLKAKGGGSHGPPLWVDVRRTGRG